jgi:hypothetical protein
MAGLREEPRLLRRAWIEYPGGWGGGRRPRPRWRHRSSHPKNSGGRAPSPLLINAADQCGGSGLAGAHGGRGLLCLSAEPARAGVEAAAGEAPATTSRDTGEGRRERDAAMDASSYGGRGRSFDARAPSFGAVMRRHSEVGPRLLPRAAGLMSLYPFAPPTPYGCA